MVALLGGCVCDNPSGHAEKSCGLIAATPGEIVCKHGLSDCSWRGQACVLDECGLPPQYPGYAASPSEDGRWTTIQTSQWDRLNVYMDEMRAFQACELARP